MPSGVVDEFSKSLTMHFGRFVDVTEEVRHSCPRLDELSRQFLADAMVDDLIRSLPSLDGCCGFLVAAKTDEDDEDYNFCHGALSNPVSTGLADKLTANGGTLLELGKSLSDYGIDSQTCSEVILFAVTSEVEKQPTVFKKDIQHMGFGDIIYSYVKLSKEDKELMAAREYFAGPLFPWLQIEDRLSQGLEFSMEDRFSIDESRLVLTVHIVQKDDGLHISCTGMNGDVLCSLTLDHDDVVAKFEGMLCEQLQWVSVTLWSGADKLSDSDIMAKFSVLTAEQHNSMERVSGCYQRHQFGVRPAGYSASSTSSSDLLVLEPGRAGIQYYFKGDYKRAEELRKLVMTNARWTIQRHRGGEHVVRIAGKAKLDRYWVHERSGPSGMSLNGYECYALVTIPLCQLGQSQYEKYHFSSTPSSGWTCGAEDYGCSLFMPMCLLNALRSKPATEEDPFILRTLLNRGGSPDYPYNKIASSSGSMFGGGQVLRVSEGNMAMLKHFRESSVSKEDMSMDEIMQLQASAPHVLPASVADEIDQ